MGLGGFYGFYVFNDLIAWVCFICFHIVSLSLNKLKRVVNVWWF
ncbi:hypothetical protein HMPREF1430_01196 [Helicobacter pylori GAM96Ai]|nr:hypothetical protein HMPREF1430_01196 [Helicobacter pylori GAM96Ai]